MIDPQSILEQHSIDTLADTWSTLHWHLSKQSANSHLIFDQFISVGWHSVNYWLTVDQVLTKHQLGCWSSIGWGCPSRVPTDQHLTLGQLLTDCWSSVDQVSVGMLYWLRVSIKSTYRSTLDRRCLLCTWSQYSIILHFLWWYFLNKCLVFLCKHKQS